MCVQSTFTFCVTQLAIRCGTEIIVAVTSWGDAVCVATGTTYRVDISDSLSFIDDVINPIAISPAPAANRLTTTWGDVKSSLVYPGE
jgi:hypothetical protein